MLLQGGTPIQNQGSALAKHLQDYQQQPSLFLWAGVQQIRRDMGESSITNNHHQELLMCEETPQQSQQNRVVT